LLIYVVSCTKLIKYLVFTGRL